MKGENAPFSRAIIIWHTQESINGRQAWHFVRGMMHANFIYSHIIAKMSEPAHLHQSSDKDNESYSLIQRSIGCADVFDLGFFLIQRSNGCADLFDLGFDLDV
jgi:hypothetical protein